MREDRYHTNERILDLTLEIIYLLTGESCPPVKSADHVTIKVPLPFSLTPKRNNQKILAITKKIIELLTGEVPIRCQDVTVYFSMEEWEYLEGHKDIYKDVMMEDHQTLTAPDVSSSGNPPERCPRPLSSWKTTPDDQEIPHDHQDEGLIAIKVEVIDKEEQNALYGQQIAEKEKGWDLRTVKVEEEEITLGANTDRNNVKRTLRKHEDCSKESKVIIKDSSGGHTFTQKIYPGLHSVQRWSNPLNAEKFAGYGRRIHQNVHPVKKAFECPDCGKCFYKRSEYIKHERVHTGEKPFQCLECGKYYTNRSVLVKHQKLHTGEKPFMCSDCGKCFSQKAHLLRHQMLHTGEKPLTCQDCGKRFSRKSNLIDHQRTHTGEKPFPCPECDKSFTQKSILIRHQRTHQKSIPIHHQRTHQDEKFVICSECGKIFTHKAFLIHQNTHRGEKPFPCYQCGQCFTQKSDLMAHQRYHTAEYPGLS